MSDDSEVVLSEAHPPVHSRLYFTQQTQSVCGVLVIKLTPCETGYGKVERQLSLLRRTVSGFMRVPAAISSRTAAIALLRVSNRPGSILRLSLRASAPPREDHFERIASLLAGSLGSAARSLIDALRPVLTGIR